MELIINQRVFQGSVNSLVFLRTAYWNNPHAIRIWLELIASLHNDLNLPETKYVQQESLHQPH